MFTLRQRLTQAVAGLLSVALIGTSCPIAEAAPAAAPDALARFAPASGLGFLTDSFHGSTDRTVVLIQDLHLHYPTQQRIVKMLDQLYAKGLLSGPLAIEGTDGPYDTSRIASYPEGKIKSELVDYFMKKGELSAPEAFSILRGDGHLLYGVEKGQYYELNRNLFKASREDRKALQAQLTRIQSGLALLKRKQYSYALRRLDKEEAFSMSSTEKLLDRKLALCKDDATRNLVTADHMLRLVQRLVRQEVTLEEARYIAQRLPAFVDLTNKLLAVIPAKAGTQSISGLGPDFRRGDVKSILTETLKASIDFYLVALMRNQPLADNTLSLLKSTPAVALVAGGFHTKGLTAAFKKAGVSYVVITPAITETPDAAYHELYEKRLSGEHLTMQEMSQDFGQPMPVSVSDSAAAIVNKSLTSGADGKAAALWTLLHGVKPSGYEGKIPAGPRPMDLRLYEGMLHGSNQRAASAAPPTTESEARDFVGSTVHQFQRNEGTRNDGFKGTEFFWIDAHPDEVHSFKRPSLFSLFTAHRVMLDINEMKTLARYARHGDPLDQKAVHFLAKPRIHHELRHRNFFTFVISLLVAGPLFLGAIVLQGVQPDWWTNAYWAIPALAAAWTALHLSLDLAEEFRVRALDEADIMKAQQEPAVYARAMEILTKEHNSLYSLGFYIADRATRIAKRQTDHKGEWADILPGLLSGVRANSAGGGISDEEFNGMPAPAAPITTIVMSPGVLYERPGVFFQLSDQGRAVLELAKNLRIEIVFLENKHFYWDHDLVREAARVLGKPPTIAKIETYQTPPRTLLIVFDFKNKALQGHAAAATIRVHNNSNLAQEVRDIVAPTPAKATADKPAAPIKTVIIDVDVFMFDNAWPKEALQKLQRDGVRLMAVSPQYSPSQVIKFIEEAGLSPIFGDWIYGNEEADDNTWKLQGETLFRMITAQDLDMATTALMAPRAAAFGLERMPNALPCAFASFQNASDFDSRLMSLLGPTAMDGGRIGGGSDRVENELALHWDAITLYSAFEKLVGRFEAATTALTLSNPQSRTQLSVAYEALRSYLDGNMQDGKRIEEATDALIDVMTRENDALNKAKLREHFTDLNKLGVSRLGLKEIPPNVGQLRDTIISRIRLNGSGIVSLVLVVAGIGVVLFGRPAPATGLSSDAFTAFIKEQASTGFNPGPFIATCLFVMVTMALSAYAAHRYQRRLALADRDTLDKKLKEMASAEKSWYKKLKEARADFKDICGEFMVTLMAKLPGDGNVEGRRDAASAYKVLTTTGA